MALPPALNESPPHHWRQSAGSFFVKFLAAILVASALSQLKLDFFESFFQDQRIRIKPLSSTSNQIELVLVDFPTVERLKGVPKAKDMTIALKAVLQAHPRFVLLDFEPQSIEGSQQEQIQLAHLLGSNKNIFVATDELEQKGEVGKLLLPSPFEKTQLASAPKTIDNKIFAKDGVTRRMLISYLGQPLFHHHVAASYSPEIKDPNEIHGQFEFLGSQQIYIDFHPTGFYPRTSLFDLVQTDPNANEWSNRFQDKIVIIGYDNQRTSSEYVLTPFSRELLAMSRVEMHANMFDTLIQNSAARFPPQWLHQLIIFIISFFTIWVVLSLTPVRGLVILLGLALGYLFVTYICFWLFRLWLPTVTPLLANFLVYYFFIPYRLIRENRRSWEYYQKNQLLQQVEELKTNFISMMSHDLKTPIARIIGMTEVIQSDSQALSHKQAEAVEVIKTSGQDLLSFINAILAYGKIESQGVQLHLQSQDINELLREVIRKHEFLAKLKRIQIISELEPLFPIQIDPELMKQVFSNLVENAIKYSPEDTKVLVTTEEEDDKIVVQIADQGPGIPEDELPNVFMKFFRSKNVKSSPIKGSGLGLYLAKYFTELHGGSIHVESSYGQGSTFTVELPTKEAK